MRAPQAGIVDRRGWRVVTPTRVGPRAPTRV